jgi:hypothetical protein
MTTSFFKELYTKYKNKLALPKPWDLVVISVLNILLTLPVFIIAHQNFLELDLKIPIDRILLFIAIFTLFHFLLIAIKKYIIIGVFFYFILLIYGTLFGNYSFYRVYDDYRSMMYTMGENPYPQDIIIDKLLPFPNKFKVLKAIDFTNPKVRNFALTATTQHFQANQGVF